MVNKQFLTILLQGQGVMYGERCFVLWQSVAQWGSVLHSWALDRGLSGSVLTLFELHSGDDSEDQPFHTMGIYILPFLLNPCVFLFHFIWALANIFETKINLLISRCVVVTACNSSIRRRRQGRTYVRGQS